MAVYKVIQDIEAEDKLVAYLGIRQFVYLIIAAASAFIIFRMLIAPEIGPARYFVVFMFFWPMVVFGILSAPLGKDQPTEVWILSRLRFYLKPRLRVWNQSGLKELVTITAPKRVEKVYTNGLSQTEVRSRLQALATTLDSRGWAVKNVNLNLYDQPGYVTGQAVSDRLVDATSMPQADEGVDVRAEDDILDPMHNKTAQHFDRLMQESGDKQRQQAAAKPDFYFMHEDTTVDKDGKKHTPKKAAVIPSITSSEYVFGEAPVVQPGTEHSGAVADNDEASKQLLEYVHRAKEQDKAVTSHTHEKRIPTMAERREQEAREREKSQAELTASQQAAMMELAHNNDFTVSTAGGQANRIMAENQQPQVPAVKKEPDEPTEIVIQLH